MMVGWARFCAHADAKPRGQTIYLSAHPTLFSENKFTLIKNQRWLDRIRGLVECFDCNVTRLGERGATSGWTGWFVPVSCLHLAEGWHLLPHLPHLCQRTRARHALTFQHNP